MRYLVLALGLLPLPALADDRSYLTALLEDNLSGAGRQVVITGFAGALSSRATIDQLTIADEVGVWLTLKDVALDWNRSALLSGAVSVNELSAAEIVLDRLPQPGESAPSPEAGTFALPELPVSVEISNVAAKRIVLGPTVLGSAVEGSFAAAVSLIGGEGKASLTLERTDDGPEGAITLSADYSNASQRLSLDLSAREGAGGIAATLLGLPGEPAASLEIRGNGPFSDFAADVALATDGVDRLAGQITVKSAENDATGFAATLAGDLAPLFLPEYAEFFGNRVALDVTGQREADGRLDLSKLDLSARALTLQGALSLAPDGLPRSFALTGRIAAADGAPVLLPLTTDLPVRVTAADIDLGFDAAQDEGWRASASIQGLDRADFRASRLTLSGSGRIARGAAARIGATLRFDAEGLSPTDPALAAALGSFVSGDAVAYWTQGDGAVSIPRLNLLGENYSARLGGRITGLDEALTISGRAEAEMADMGRLSGLAGRKLGGAGTVTVFGSGSPLTGAFDAEVTAEGTDLSADIPELDGLLRGNSRVELSARRDQTGTELRRLSLVATSLSATAQGRIASTGADLTADLAFADLSVMGARYGGALQGKARLTGTLTEGGATLDAIGTGLRVGQAEADKLLAGQSNVALELTLKDGAVQVQRAEVSNAQLRASATGALSAGVQTLDVTARLANLGLILPEFPGPLTIEGKISQQTTGTEMRLVGKGPGGIDAVLAGRLASGFAGGDLTLKGKAQAALANAFVEPRSVQGGVGFDLRLNGPLALSSLTGAVNLAEGRLSDPALTFALQGIAARAELRGGRIVLDATLPVTSGGEISVAGSAAMTAPFAGDLAIGLRRVTLRDPELYETTLSGDLQVTGPLAGGARISGRLALAEAELRVPSTGFGGAAGIEGLRHLAEPAAVRATRARAGLLDGPATGGNASGPAYGLDITVSAPNQVFVRGRGLDAELGGEVRLLGSTAAVVPSGAFNLIRGRLDILGKRLDLSEALMQMEGELIPFLRIVAQTQTNDATVGVTIEGPATDPKVSFTSVPEMPEEEVLAQLLFGQNLQNLSALQALQLANAVATLAGRGGSGVVDRLRSGFGLDNLDVKTSAAGGAELTAGKYLTRNIYSEVTVDQSGKSEINLNLDVSRSITLRGRASSDGTTGVGVYLEKDY
ncbi:translocation/assembly module TamB domain-containing protein [Paracoccaceae bacterium]